MLHRLSLTLLLLVPLPALCGQEPADSVARRYEIEQVTVSGRSQRLAVGGIADGTLRINMAQSDALPRFAGTIDPLRILQLLPGVQTPGDGNSGFFVRGGDAGQSTVLLNNAPLYSYAHLLGFFSAFNPSHIVNYDFDKAGIGAETGHAPGAMLRARTVENIPEKWGLKGDVGIIAAQATLSIPLGRKAALHLSGRRSYAEWLIALISLSENDDLRYALQDYDATLVWNLSQKHRLTVNGHYGDDRIRMNYEQYLIGGKIGWHTLATSARLESRYSDRLWAEHTLYYSDYANRATLSTTGTSIRTPSSIADGGYKGSIRWRTERVDLRAGILYACRDIRPQYAATDYNLATTDRTVPQPHYLSHETAPYVAATFRIGQKIAVGTALRYSIYAVRKLGGGSTYTTSQPEPGVSAEYCISERHRLKAVYAYGAQYTHLVPVSNASFSTDFWMPATAENAPMRSHNLTAGYYASLAGGRLRLSAEAYYRRMHDAVEYDLPLMSMLHAQVEIEKYIRSGEGEAYGLELMAAYATPRLNGWISYTLGRSVRRFDELNGGDPFPAKQDRRHDLSVAVTWHPTPKWDMGAVFVYATGAAYTSSVDFYTSGGAFLRGHGTYNGSRLPAYHRLDLSVTRWIGDAHRHGINFSIYNCYARKNPLYVSWPIHYNTDEQVLRTARRKHNLYSILPSLSWTFRF